MIQISSQNTTIKLAQDSKNDGYKKKKKILARHRGKFFKIFVFSLC